MNRRLALIGAAIIILGIVLSSALYTVSETQQALVLQFGEPVDVQRTAGLKVKIPFVQDVTYYEKRVLDVDPPVEQVLLADNRRLDVDVFARYRIVDPLQFYQAVRTEDIARQRLSTIIVSMLRNTLGEVTQLEVLSEGRATIMEDIRDRVQAQVLSARLGVEIVDVRIIRADVPEGTLQSVFDRMRSERDREAAEFRAQGAEQALLIRARADRERVVILAEAARDSQILRGEGDADAINIQAKAFGADPQFFSFYRTLQAYRESMADQNTTLVLSPTGDFFRYFNDLTGAGLVPSITGETPPDPNAGPPEVPPTPELDQLGITLPPEEPAGDGAATAPLPSEAETTPAPAVEPATPPAPAPAEPAEAPAPEPAAPSAAPAPAAPASPAP